jgi:outer membrane protein assembly factor BamB
MKISDIVFIGIKGSAIALNRRNGEQVWATHLKSSDFVNVVVENDKIFTATAGEIYCLDALTGRRLWHNKLKGFGTGLVTIATSESIRCGSEAVMSEKRRRDAQAAASGTAAV